MRNFFYYFYYRLKQANSSPRAAGSGGELAAFITIVLLLVLNCLSVYFVLIRLINNAFVFRIWREDKVFNGVISLLIIVAVPVSVYAWYRYHISQIEQVLVDYRNESLEARRIGGVLILGYILFSCVLLILALFSPAFLIIM